MIRIIIFSILLISSAYGQTLDHIVAVVNDEVVLNSELEEMERTVAQQMRQRNMSLPSSDAYRAQVLERLILQKIQLQRANDVGIRLGDDALNIAIKQIADQNNLTLSEFRGVLERDGFDFNEFRNSIREDMIINRLHKKEVSDRIVVSDREIDDFLAMQEAHGNAEDAYHLLHILISVPDAATPEKIQQAKDKLNKVQNLLASGADFSEVASAYSDGQNALEGGDLGWRLKGELPSLFAKAVPTMNAGDVSDVLRSGSGFHLVKVAEKKSQEEHIVEQTLASHILIKTNELVSDEDAEQQLEKLKQRIVTGESFADLAKAHSDDTVSAIRGGSLGWTTKGMMVPEFEEQMDKLEKGQMSPVFKSRFGWHLIRLDDRREQNMAEEYRRNKAREQIHNRKATEEIDEWLRALRDEAYVEYRNL